MGLNGTMLINLTTLNLSLSLSAVLNIMSVCHLCKRYHLASPAVFGPGHYKGGITSPFYIMRLIHVLFHFCSPEKLSLLLPSVKRLEIG